MPNIKKILTFSVNVGIGKESKQPYLFVNNKKGDKMFLVNLIKDSKKHVLSVPKGSTSVDITCTSYLYKFKNDKDQKVNSLTLFDVRDVVFSK